jgi:hypothetical protein
MSPWPADLRARFTDPVNDQPVARDTEMMTFRNCLSQFQQFVAPKLDQLTTFCAIKMIVLRVAVIVLVYRSTIQRKPSQ